MVARVNVNKRLGRHDQAAGAAAEISFADLAAALQDLDDATNGAAYRKTFDDLAAGVTKYHETYHKAVDLEHGVDDMINGAMAKMAAGADRYRTINAAALPRSSRKSTITTATMASTSALILYLSIGGLLVGAALAWLIGRGISRPVVGMCRGDAGARGRRQDGRDPRRRPQDEIGQMADTVAVFRRT